MKNEDRDNLNTEDATLMLYLAGELEPADAQAFAARLTSDAALTARSESLADVDATLRGYAGRGDVTSLESRRALNNSLRLVREQALLLQNRSVLRPRRVRLSSVPKWGWGVAAAACLAVGFVFWANNSDPASLGNPQDDRTQFVDGRPVNGDFPRGGFGVSAAFAAIEPASSEDTSGEIDNQLDALNVLATMNELN